jgi:beta-galactosidase
MPKYKYLDWTVPYTPGKLTACGYDRGQKVVAQWSYRTAGPAAALQLRDEVPTLTANGESIAPVAVKVVDAEGTMVPHADNLVRFSISGAGTIAGVCNGNPACHESNVGHKIKAFNGLCLVMIRASHSAGVIIVTANTTGFPPAILTIHTQTDKRTTG